MTAATADTARELALPPGRPARSSSGGGRPWQRCSKRHAQQRLHPALYVVVSCSASKQAKPLASATSLSAVTQPVLGFLSRHIHNDLADC